MWHGTRIFYQNQQGINFLQDICLKHYANYIKRNTGG
jgi:hypothetical protein